MKQLKTYDAIAPGYNELYGHEQSQKAALIANRLSILPEHTLLDIGCGTGIAMGHFSCKIIGIDPSRALLTQNPYPCVLGVGEYLPFPNKAFDFVVSLTAIQNFFDFEMGLSEMHRVARDYVILTILRRAHNHDAIVTSATQFFDIEERILQEKDTILICRKK